MWPQGFGYVVERWCRRDACSNEDGTREVGYGGYGVGHLSPCHAHCLAPWSQSGLPLRARLRCELDCLCQAYRTDVDGRQPANKFFSTPEMPLMGLLQPFS